MDLNATFKDEKLTHERHEEQILTYTVEEADIVVVTTWYSGTWYLFSMKTKPW